MILFWIFVGFVIFFFLYPDIVCKWLEKIFEGR